MIETQFISDQRIIDCLAAEYHIKVDNLTRIPLGADVDAAVYKAQASDKSIYFVKLKRGNQHDVGVAVQMLLHDAGIANIIAPIATHAGQPMCSVDEYTMIVYPFIEGSDGFTRDLTRNQWITFGATLRKVHDCAVPHTLINQIKKETYSSHWRDALRAIYVRIDAGLEDGDEAGAQLLTLLKEHRGVIHQLVDCAEQLAEIIRMQSPELILCHSDIHGGNVLIAATGDLYIVDWDQPIMAPKERDLMFIGGGVANVWNKPDEEVWFYAGYGDVQINHRTLAYYRCERIVQDLVEYSQQLLLSAEGGKDREVMYQQCMDMFAPNGVVDIAFKTDGN